MQSTKQISYKQLSAFFIPLGISASLTSVTHVIINGTLSRGDHAAFIIACYAIAMSLFSIVERPMIVFRQTSSALVTDKRSFNLLSRFFLYILTATMLISAIIAFSSLGPWMYITIFGATSDMVDAISIAFKVVILVAIFSGIRGLYQGIIITQLATNWLTIGVVARLIAMFLTSYIMVITNFITSVSGAIIFLVGMVVECIVSVYKGNLLLRKNVHPVDTPPLVKSNISKFYFPLMYYFIAQTILIPMIYILLAKSNNIEISIASFALAFSITNLILGFFMYTHQLVLQFYAENKKKVIKFVIFASIIPTLLLCLLCYTPLGMAFMQNVMGADEALSLATITVLKFFIIKTLVFPWVDFLNGFLMLTRQTNKMLIAQIGNLIVVFVSMLILLQLSPHLNGVNGAIAASLGELAGFIIVGIIVYQMTDQYKDRKYSSNK